MYVYSSGHTLSTTVNNGAYQDVYSGGITSDSLVTSGGTEFVSGGGKAIKTTISGSGANQTVSSGGVAVSTTISAGGEQFISGGGVDSASIIDIGSFDTISSGGRAISTMVGGQLTIGSAGVARGADVLSGGSIFDSAGAIYGTRRRRFWQTEPPASYYILCRTPVKRPRRLLPLGASKR